MAIHLSNKYHEASFHQVECGQSKDKPHAKNKHQLPNESSRNQGNADEISSNNLLFIASISNRTSGIETRRRFTKAKNLFFFNRHMRIFRKPGSRKISTRSLVRISIERSHAKLARNLTI